MPGGGGGGGGTGEAPGRPGSAGPLFGNGGFLDGKDGGGGACALAAERPPVRLGGGGGGGRRPITHDEMLVRFDGNQMSQGNRRRAYL